MMKKKLELYQQLAAPLPYNLLSGTLCIYMMSLWSSFNKDVITDSKMQIQKPRCLLLSFIYSLCCCIDKTFFGINVSFFLFFCLFLIKPFTWYGIIFHTFSLFNIKLTSNKVVFLYSLSTACELCALRFSAPST